MCGDKVIRTQQGNLLLPRLGTFFHYCFYEFEYINAKRAVVRTKSLNVNIVPHDVLLLTICFTIVVDADNVFVNR